MRIKFNVILDGDISKHRYMDFDPDYITDAIYEEHSDMVTHILYKENWYQIRPITKENLLSICSNLKT